ncbi:MAG: hypothetical protein PVF68_14695 [Acidobacteriota bacterium]
MRWPARRPRKSRLAPWYRARVAGLVLAAAITAGASPAPPDGVVLLHRLSRTAELFRDAALRFTCRETISWSGRAIQPGGEAFEYLFVYDEDEGFRDYRTPVSRLGGKHAPTEVSPLERGVPRYLSNAYLWIFAFRESRWNLHHYRVLGVEKVDGVQTTKVEFEPVPPYRDGLNDWFGVAWVDPELGQLVKVVAQRPVDYETRRKLDEVRKAELVDEVEAVFEVITTRFTEEKNGLRFPGVVEIDQSRYRWDAGTLAGRSLRRFRWRVFREAAGEEDVRPVKRVKLLEVRQRYRDYRFFSVRTSDEIREFIRGEPQRTED